MMSKSFVNDIAKLFFDSEMEVIRDNFSSFKSVAEIDSGDAFKVPSEAELRPLFLMVDGLDLFLSFHFEQQDVTIIFSSKNIKIPERLAELAECLEIHDDGESINVELEIKDKKVGSKINIFSSETFFLYISSLSLQGFLEKIEEVSFTDEIEFCIWEDFESFNSESLFFYSVYPVASSDRSAVSSTSREDLIENRAKVSHFVNAKDNKLTPSDFKFISGAPEGKVSDFFNGVFGALCYIFLSDFSSVKNDELDVYVKGYKKVTDKFSFDELKKTSHKELYDIYEWAYSDGSFVDKIGVARNVISIHLSNGRLINFSSGLLDSVRSGYELYLKENVKQYIEIKNKINDFLYSQSDKAQNLVDGLFSNLKASIWTISTFFISVFLIRVVTGKSLQGAVTYEVLLVSLLLVVITSIYVVFVYLSLQEDKNRLLEKYSEVRDRYKDLMNENDLNKIIDVEGVVKKESKYIQKRSCNYMKVWGAVTASFIFLIIILYSYSDEKEIKSPDVVQEKNFYNFICIAESRPSEKCEVETHEQKRQTPEFEIPSAPLKEDDDLRS